MKNVLLYSKAPLLYIYQSNSFPARCAGRPHPARLGRGVEVVHVCDVRLPDRLGGAQLCRTRGAGAGDGGKMRAPGHPFVHSDAARALLIDRRVTGREIFCAKNTAYMYVYFGNEYFT